MTTKQLEKLNPASDANYKAAVERLQAITARREELEQELAELLARPAPPVEALLAGEAPTAKRERAAALQDAIEALQTAALLSESIALLLDLSQARENLRVEEWYVRRLQQRVEALQ